MSEYKNYRKKNVQPMRPYIPGEDMTGISVNKEDTPELGGMIAVNPANPEDRWYVARKFFQDNYEEVTEHDAAPILIESYRSKSKLLDEKVNECARLEKEVDRLRLQAAMLPNEGKSDDPYIQSLIDAALHPEAVSSFVATETKGQEGEKG